MENICGAKRKQKDESKKSAAQGDAKRTATMKKELTTRSNAWEFFAENHQPCTQTTTRVFVVAVELSYPQNIGSIIRVAGNMNCQGIIFTGNLDNFNQRRIRGAAASSFKSVPWEFCNETEWPSKIPQDYTIVAVETTEGATNIFQTPLPKKVCFVVGNESFGITEWSLQHCNQSVYIPTPGIANKSLNVNQAATVALFEWWRQQQCW